MIDRKGHQDYVSQADRNVERSVRAALAEAFPQDAIVGEEAAPSAGTSGFTWVIDPIDGTTNFINGIPQWCVIVACVHDGRTEIGVVHDPVHDEMCHARRGGGAFCNDRPIRCSVGTTLGDGSLGIGYSGRTAPATLRRLIDGLLAAGGVFWRNGSGGLSLAYVAQGRLLGYCEAHMNGWDYLAGQLIVAEAGGRVEQTDADRAIAAGGRVVVAAPGVFDAVLALAEVAYAGRSAGSSTGRGGKGQGDRIAGAERIVDIVDHREDRPERRGDRVFHPAADVGRLPDHRRHALARALQHPHPRRPHRQPRRPGGAARAPAGGCDTRRGRSRRFRR